MCLIRHVSIPMPVVRTTILALSQSTELSTISHMQRRSDMQSSIISINPSLVHLRNMKDLQYTDRSMALAESSSGIITQQHTLCVRVPERCLDPTSGSTVQRKLLRKHIWTLHTLQHSQRHRNRRLKRRLIVLFGQDTASQRHGCPRKQQRRSMDTSSIRVVLQQERSSVLLTLQGLTQRHVVALIATALQKSDLSASFGHTDCQTVLCVFISWQEREHLNTQQNSLPCSARHAAFGCAATGTLPNSRPHLP